VVLHVGVQLKVWTIGFRSTHRPSQAVSRTQLAGHGDPGITKRPCAADADQYLPPIEPRGSCQESRVQISHREAGPGIRIPVGPWYFLAGIIVRRDSQEVGSCTLLVTARPFLCDDAAGKDGTEIRNAKCRHQTPEGTI
jgi:hypothetical protein